VEPLSAQVPENFPGVRADIVYSSGSLPLIAILPFVGRLGGEEMARLVEGIITQDLENSNRFIVSDQVPADITGNTVDYILWKQTPVSWLVTGRIEGEGNTTELILELHDLVFGRVANNARFSLPPPEFRMAVHGASDAIVEWVFDEPGIAATRIVFSIRNSDLSQDIWTVDSDGANLQQITHTTATGLGYPISLNPTWSPDGSRIAYLSYKDTGNARLYELNLLTGLERVIPALREGIFLTPTYHPDGERLFFAIDEGSGSGIHNYNVTQDCCFTTLMEGRAVEMSPTFSPAGSDFAFNSSRLGSGVPQIYLSDVTSPMQADLLSPWEFGRPGSFAAPEWSPVGNRVAFHGWVGQRGAHQILVAELNARNGLGRLLRVTMEGENEDPSWAPDGRHLVYVGYRSWGRGLFIVDILTPGSERVLVRGVDARPPSWSPSFAP
jgi:TolB protein